MAKRLNILQSLTDKASMATTNFKHCCGIKAKGQKS